MSKSGNYFILEMFKEFCRKPNIALTTSSSYNHQNNDQVKECIKFRRKYKEKCFEINTNIYLMLLQIGSTLIGTGTHYLTVIPFNRLT